MTARRLRDLLVSSRLPDVADIDPRPKEEHQ